MTNLPPVDPKLIEWLEARYPNRVPDLADSEREVWAKVGEQRVISTLKQVIAKVIKENLRGQPHQFSQGS